MILAVVTVVAGAAWAQEESLSEPWFLAQLDEPGFPPFGAGGPPGMDSAEASEHRKHLEQLRLLKLLELLDLSEDKETQFIVAFRDLRREMRVVDDQRHEVVERLAEGLKSGSLSDTQIQDAVNQTLAFAGQRQELTVAFVERVRPLLTAEQLGKMMVFHDRFEYELLERVKAFHGRGGRGPFGRGSEKGN